MIRLKHIYKSYPLGDATVDVLKDVNLHVRPQEFVSILGPSGSGKSTLMNIIGCLDVADSGEYGLFSGSAASLDWTTALAAVLFCAVIGVAFGGYPAAKASRLQPIEALHTL